MLSTNTTQATTPPRATDTRERILKLIERFILQRPRFGNHGCAADMAMVQRHRRDALKLLDAVRASSVTEKELRKALQYAYSGRLYLTETPEGGLTLGYNVGGYFPTEYRAAACSVLSSALWYHERDKLPKEAHGISVGDLLAKQFRRTYGAALQRRWFR